jgi:hypothetical protein
LEHLAKGLLQATEGLVAEEIALAKSIRAGDGRQGPLYLRLFIFPVIVTNAKIAVCRFNAERVRLDSGVLLPDDAEIFEAPMVRFRKSLVTEFPEGVFYTLEAANRKRERTVLIVNAEYLTKLLKDWKVGRMPNRPYAIESLRASWAQLNNPPG